MSWTSLFLRAFICLKSIILSTPRSFDQKIAVLKKIILKKMKMKKILPLKLYNQQLNLKAVLTDYPKLLTFFKK